MPTPQACFRPIRFSSSLYPERERVPAWREFFGPTMFGADVEPLGDAAYRQDIEVRQLPGINLLSASNSPVRFSRSRSMLADGRGDFGLHINSSWSCVRQRGREIACDPGEPILVTSAEAASMTSPDASHFLCLHVDRSLLLDRVANPDDRVLDRVPVNSPALRYLLGYMQFLQGEQAGEMDADLAANAGRHLVDLLSLLFGAAGDSAAMAQAGGLRAAQMLSIKRSIADNLADPALCVEQVAGRHGLSVRAVQRLFEREGVTFSDYVLGRRLNRAYRMLGDPEHARLLVIDIAMACGFGDLSYFNRCFRRTFGGSPRHFRGL